MLLILIPAAWLTISILILAICTMAARGDEAIAVASQASTAIRVHRGRVRSSETRLAVATGRGERARGARCAAGS